MCKLCEGTHVIHEQGSFSVQYRACPNCGPIDEKVLQEKYRQRRARLEAARVKLEGKSA